MPSGFVQDRRTFWPRAGPAQGFVPDLGDLRPCAHCGYNLRGLTLDSTCPECGATRGIPRDSEPIAWNDDPSPFSFFQTIWMVITTPADLAIQVWTRDVLWRRAAQRFRRLNMLLGLMCVTAVIVAITAAVSGLDGALWCAPADLAAVTWWFILVCGEPAHFLAGKGTPSASRRAELLADYLTAALILSPLHLGLLVLPLHARHVDPVIIALILHGGLLLLQMLIMAAGEAALLWQLVELPRGGAWGIALGNLLVHAGKGMIYLIVLPALFATVAGALIGG